MGELDDAVSMDAGDTAYTAVGDTVGCDDNIDTKRVDLSVEGVEETGGFPDATLHLFGIDAVA